VIQHGESAVAPVLRAHREIEAIETAAAQAVQSPEHYRAYLDALRGTSTGWHEFDAAACRYALSLGNVDFAAIARWMRQALHDGTAGFRMIEPDGVDKPDELAAQKKSMPSESIGCVTWLRRAVRFARRLLRKR
jgi:transposase-like protein